MLEKKIWENTISVKEKFNFAMNTSLWVIHRKFHSWEIEEDGLFWAVLSLILVEFNGKTGKEAIEDLKNSEDDELMTEVSIIYENIISELHNQAEKKKK